MMKCSQYIESIIKISLKEKTALKINEFFSIVKFQKKETILLEGAKAENLYLIINGIIRGYYIDKTGNDITKCFCGENEFFSSEGLRTRSISTFNIEAIEECTCIKMPYVIIDEIIATDEEIKDLFISYYFQEVQRIENKNKNLALLNAEERYLAFCGQYPKLYDRIELNYVASYIGIRAGSLSRIRKKLKN